MVLIWVTETLGYRSKLSSAPTFHSKMPKSFLIKKAESPVSDGKLILVFLTCVKLPVSSLPIEPCLASLSLPTLLLAVHFSLDQ